MKILVFIFALLLLKCSGQTNFQDMASNGYYGVSSNSVFGTFGNTVTLTSNQVVAMSGQAVSGSNFLTGITYQQIFTAMGAFGGTINTNLTCMASTITTNIGLTPCTGLTAYTTNNSRNAGFIYINYTGGAAVTTTNIFNLVFGCTYTNPPSVVILPANFNAALIVNGYKAGDVQTIATTTQATYYSTATAFAANTPYLFSYIVGGGYP